MAEREHTRCSPTQGGFRREDLVFSATKRIMTSPQLDRFNPGDRDYRSLFIMEEIMTAQEITPHDQRKRGIAALFNSSAATYDTVGPRFFSYFGRRLVEQAQIARGGDVLDVATGRGAILFPASEQVGPEGQVTAIDIAEGMIEQLAHEIAERGISNANVKVMDAEYLDFPDASFD